jgi:hypothetical protein
MKIVLDIQYFDDKGSGNLNSKLARYAYGVFLIQDLAGNTFIAVKNGDMVDNIRLEGENKDLIVRLYDEAKERESREKKMAEFKDLLLKVCDKNKKIEESLISERKKVAEALDRIVERYIRETYLNVAEMKKQKDEAKEKEPLSEDCFKGFISEAALERIIREIVSKKEA